MIPNEYTYLLGSILCLIPWVIIYFLRKDLQREMLFVSFSFMIVAVLAEYFAWTVDYWHPLTITGTRIGVEDFILGFGNGGLIAVLYETLFKKKHKVLKKMSEDKKAIVIILVVLGTFSLLFWIFHLNSSLATPIAFILGSVFVLFWRRDLFWQAVLTALIFTIGIIPVYLIMESLSPGFIEKTWFFDKLTGVTIVSVPLEDLLYYFSLGTLLGPLYLLWQNKSLVSKS